MLHSVDLHGATHRQDAVDHLGIGLEEVEAAIDEEPPGVQATRPSAFSSSADRQSG